MGDTASLGAQRRKRPAGRKRSAQDTAAARHQRFVEEYLIDLNATQAAIRAGFSAKTAGSQGARLLKNVKVAEAIRAAIEARSIRARISSDQVIEELARIGFADIRKAVRWRSNVVVPAADMGDLESIMEESGELPDMQPLITNQVELVNSDEIDDDTAAAIAEIGMTDKGSLKIKFHDKRAALVDLGKHLGIFTDKPADTGPITVVIQRFGGGSPEGGPAHA